MTQEVNTNHPIFSLSPHTVYWLADGMRTRRGLEYWQRQRVLEFRWDSEGKKLCAVVLGVRRYRVTMDAVEGSLRCQCTCQDAASGATCKHMVAAAAAFFAATKGTQFLNRPHSEAYLKELRSGIYGKKEKPSINTRAIRTNPKPVPSSEPRRDPAFVAIGLAFEDDRHWSAIALKISGDRVREEPWDPKLQLTCAKINLSGDAVRAVFEHLELKRDPESVWLRLGGKWSRITGIDKRERQVSARLIRKEDEVGAEFEFGGDRDSTEVLCGLSPEVGLTRECRLVLLTSAPGVQKLSLLPYLLLAEGHSDLPTEPLHFVPWKLPATVYNPLADYFFDRSPKQQTYEGVTFLDGSRKVTPQLSGSAPGLRFDEVKEFGGYVASLHWEGKGFSVPLETPAQSLDHIFAAEGDRSLFAGRARMERLAHDLVGFAGEPDPKKRRSLAREIVASEPRRNAARYTRRVLQALESELQASCQWCFANSQPGGSTPWEFAEVTFRDVVYWDLYLAALFCPGTMRDRFRGGGKLTVSAPALSRNLSVIFAECRERGVSLLLNGHPVETEALAISVEVSEAKDKRDWFELKPEIRLAGRALSTADWEAIADGNGIAQTKTGPVVIDVDSLNRLREARSLLQSRETRKGIDDHRFQVPRLRIFEWLDLQRLGVSLKLPAEGRKVLESLARFRELETTPLPQGLRAELRDYQKSGYDWFAFLYRHRFGACLADDMGLGKTVQAIALLQALKEGAVTRYRGTAKRPHLVVAPASLIFNWRSEIERFAPGLTVLEYMGGERSADFKGVDVVLTTYETARRDRELLRKQTFNVLIFDEAQAVKNRASARHRAVRELTAECRICLTGTPVENHLGEYRAILDLALPGIFDDLDIKAKRGGGEEMERRILARSRPFVLRRTKTAVLSQLPEKTETDIVLELAPRQKALYVREVARVREEVAAAFKRLTPARAGVAALSALNRLRLLCVSPALLDPKEKPASPKFDFALEAVTELLDEGNAVLVFSQFVKALDLFDARLKQAGVESVRLEGKTTQKQRRERVQHFQSGAGPAVFLLSLKAGGVGLNLTRANHVIHLDPWWNPAVESQASDRAHRIGQERKVLIQRLSMRGTIEEKIAELKADKKALYQRVLGSNEKGKGSASLSRDDLAFLLDGDA